MKLTRLFFAILIASFFIVSCGDKCDDIVCQNLETCNDGQCDCPDEFYGNACQNQVWQFSANNYTNQSVQEAMINMADGDTIRFAAGTYTFESTLSIDDKNDVVLIGAGMEETIFDFSNQTVGAEGLKVTANNTILANFTIKNTVGDAIKVKDSDGFSFINVATIWEGVADESNGAYGLYPVSSKNVLIDGCLAKGASDAGLYVGQCEFVIVRNCTADNNVAGIEIENTKYADVYNNTAVNNTGGILVFDLPDLPAGQGTHCRVFDNIIEENNYKNFAPEGNIVASVSPGTGIMILASENVEVFNNTFTNNNIMSIGLVNYEVIEFLLEQSWDDESYIPYPRNVWVHDNTITSSYDCPPEEDWNDVASILMPIFPLCNFPEVLWDGVPFTTTAENQNCVQNSGIVVDLDLENFPTHSFLYDISDFDCTGNSLPEVSVDAPTLK